jgi:phosphoserine aminotransferase
VADNQSMYNTPPTWGIYVAGLTFQWLLQQSEGALTGVAAMEHRNIAKATLLYDFIDGSAFYENKVDSSCRSRMNIPFFLRDESRNDAFLAGARDAGLLQLKGHKSVGGMRASIYNAMPLSGVQALVTYMREFERSHA